MKKIILITLSTLVLFNANSFTKEKINSTSNNVKVNSKIPKRFSLLKNDTSITDNLLNNNAIIGSIGLFGYEVYYERILKQNMWNENIKSFARAGAVFAGSFYNGDGTFATVQGGLLFGYSHHLEVAAGPAFLIEGRNVYSDKTIEMAGNIGYRYQKPNGNFTFRIGGGFPLLVYTGIGFSL